jgi:hypothetical protein
MLMFSCDIEVIEVEISFLSEVIYRRVAGLLARELGDKLIQWNSKNAEVNNTSDKD